MIELFLLLILGAFATGPWIDTGEGPNKCYVVGRDMAQTHPCKPEETRGRLR